MKTNGRSDNKEIERILDEILKRNEKISEQSSNYYNSVIRFIYDVVLYLLINYKQIPMYKKKRKLPKILSDEELNVFFNACDNYLWSTVPGLIDRNCLKNVEKAKRV